MKRFLYTLLFSTAFFFGMALNTTTSYAEETETKELIATSGQCGENVYWKIEGTTLTIYGTGDMYDYDGDTYNCEGLPDFSKVKVGGDVKAGNSLIQKIVVEDGVTSVGRCAFYDTGTEVQIGKDVSIIRHDGFYSFNGTEITIPGNVKEIGDNAFSYSDLETVDLEEGVKILRYGAFWRSQIKTVEWPDSIDTVEFSVFSGSYWLDNQVDQNGFIIKGTMLLGYKGKEREVTVPDGITSIQGDGFGDTSFPRSDVDKVVLPDSLTYIGCYTFKNSQIKEITLNDNLTYIGDEAFSCCNNLETIKIPKNVEYIGTGAYGGGWAIPNVKRTYEVDSANEIYSVPDECNVIYDKKHNKVVAASVDSKIPSGTKIIGGLAFANFDIENIDLPDTVEDIEEQAFYGTKIKKIKIPSKVTKIKKWTFLYCGDLESVELSPNTTYIGQAAFYGTAISLIDLPESVTEIGVGAFEDCEKLEKVKLPSNIKKIDQMAFYMTAITDITIPEKVEVLGESAFAHNGALINVEVLNVSGIKTLGENIFSDCPSVKMFKGYHCNMGSSTKGHLYSYENTTQGENIEKQDLNEWSDFVNTYYYSVINKIKLYDAEQIHLYAQSKEEVLAGNMQKPELPDNESGTTRQDGNTTSTEKTTEAPRTTEKTTEAVTGETKKGPQITCSKLIKVKLKNLKKHSKKISLRARTTSDGKLQYKITKYPKGAKKYISVNKKGMVTMKKGAKKGNYVVTITSLETQVYTKMSKNVTIRVK